MTALAGILVRFVILSSISIRHPYLALHERLLKRVVPAIARFAH